MTILSKNNIQPTTYIGAKSIAGHFSEAETKLLYA